MADPWGDALQEAYVAAPASKIVLATIELRHDTFVDTLGVPYAIRMVRDHGQLLQEVEGGGPDIYGHFLKLESDAPMNPGAVVIFQAVMFDITLPEQSDSQVGNMTLTIDNATKMISKTLDAAVRIRASMQMTYREYLSDDLNTVQLKIGNLSIKSVTSNVFRITATAQFNDLVNKKYPGFVYRPKDFPGLET